MTDPSVLLAHTVRLDGAYDLAVTDSFSSRTVTIVAGGSTRYARILLADPLAAGTSVSDPLELLLAIQTALNAAPGTGLWSVSMGSDGRVCIAYGGAGTGTLTFNQTALRNLLGWSTNYTASLGPIYGARLPAACLVATCADDSDTDWQIRPTGIAAAETQGGVTYAVDSGNRAVTRSIRLRFLPTTSAELGSGEYLTPALPPDAAADSTRWTAPSTTAWGQNDHYTAHEFIATAHRLPGARCGFAIGSMLQAVGGVGGFVVGSISAETLRSEETFPLTVEGFYKYRDCVMKITRTGFVDF